ncbi:MAG: SRPBCC domain-containing protein [Flavobacteriales bacterium]|nr:SRPBCC domain-containing protein [Flavobacteriales bacterium]
MATKDFKKYYTISAPPDEVYTALTFQKSIELWTDDEAIMTNEPGSEFSLWGGSIVGRNLEFEPNKKIVQQWYFDGQEEHSIVTIKLHPHKKGTSVELRHTNIPENEFDDFAEGWDEYYFGNLIVFLEDDGEE